MSYFGHGDNFSTNAPSIPMDTLGSSAVGFSGDLSGVDAMDVGARGLLGLLTRGYQAVRDGVLGNLAYDGLKALVGGSTSPELGTPTMDESGLAGGIGYGVDGGFNGAGMGVADSNGPGMGIGAGVGGLY